jgi:hypothetical protein
VTLYVTRDTGKWLWQKFTSSARSDKLELHHWQKSTVVLDDYHFAKFNKQMGVRDFAMFAPPSPHPAVLGPPPPPPHRSAAVDASGGERKARESVTCLSGTRTKSTRRT